MEAILCLCIVQKRKSCYNHFFTQSNSTPLQFSWVIWIFFLSFCTFVFGRIKWKTLTSMRPVGHLKHNPASEGRNPFLPRCVIFLSWSNWHWWRWSSKQVSRGNIYLGGCSSLFAPLILGERDASQVVCRYILLNPSQQHVVACGM